MYESPVTCYYNTCFGQKLQWQPPIYKPTHTHRIKHYNNYKLIWRERWTTMLCPDGNALASSPPTPWLRLYRLPWLRPSPSAMVASTASVPRQHCSMAAAILPQCHADETASATALTLVSVPGDLLPGCDSLVQRKPASTCHCLGQNQSSNLSSHVACNPSINYNQYICCHDKTGLNMFNFQ